MQRVEFARDDGLRVYVDTASGRLASMVDAPKAAGSLVFRNLHNWVFIDNQLLRHGAMLVFLLGGVFVGVMGAVGVLVASNLECLVLGLMWGIALVLLVGEELRVSRPG